MADLETFFEYSGFVGEGANQRAYKYVAYRVTGQTAWFMKGRYMVDFDGAPNCYHPNNAKLLPIRDYPTVDIMAWDGVLDSLADAKNDDGTWASVVLNANGDPIVQGDDDPCPGYYVSTVPLQDGTQPTTSARRYADARVIPYFALPSQILAQKGAWLKMIAGGHTGDFGDYVTAVNLKTNDYGHAVIGDTGNKPHFGEGSYALGKSINLLTGTYEPDVLYIICPGSGAGRYTIPDADSLRQTGEQLFSGFGGMDQVAQVLASMG
ncbi:MAG TPA: hypothetical protein VFF06_00295 [Polyangia bacterium]|nr:hypothetical protein [Polyangia bacterium]